MDDIIFTDGSSTITTTTGSGGSFSLPEFIWKTPEDWEDCFPGWARVQDMCEQYPGLKVAFENFKTVYQLVKDDYDSPKDEK